MDPLSNTAGALSISRVLFQMAVFTKDCVKGLDEASRSISDVLEETQTMQLAL